MVMTFNPMMLYVTDNILIFSVHAVIAVAGIWLGCCGRYMGGRRGLHFAFVTFWVSGALYHLFRVFVPDKSIDAAVWAAVTFRAVFAIPILYYIPELVRATFRLPTQIQYDRALVDLSKSREDARKWAESERDKRKAMERVMRRWKREVDGFTDMVKTHDEEKALLHRAETLASELTVIADQMQGQETPLPPPLG